MWRSPAKVSVDGHLIQTWQDRHWISSLAYRIERLSGHSQGAGRRRQVLRKDPLGLSSQPITPTNISRKTRIVTCGVGAVSL